MVVAEDEQEIIKQKRRCEYEKQEDARKTNFWEFQ
jgi:hypothetical protein